MGVNVENHYMRGGERKARANQRLDIQSFGRICGHPNGAGSPSACSDPSRGVHNKADSEDQGKRDGRIPAAFSNRGGSNQVSAQMPRKGKLAFTRTVARISRTMPSPTNCLANVALSE